MPQALRPILHRLRASCGFCGAQTLAQACAALHRVLATTDARDHEVQASLAAFRHALAETRAALRAALEGDA
jgi:HPt (histidine-containing phosphotransfer) domain-containing protein